MITVKEINNFIDKIAPYETQMKFDNAGFLIGNLNSEVKRVLVSLDITKAVVQEAAAKNAQLILSHHPVIFHPVKRIMCQDIPYMLIQNDISAICAHTNLDMAEGGVNDVLAEKIGLKKVKPFVGEFERPYYKIIVFIPHDYGKKVLAAMSQAGAGNLGNYSGCSFFSRGTGAFIPEEGAKPFIGENSKQTFVDEDRIEMICPHDKLDAVISSMKAAHPYEMPAYDVFEDYSVKKQAYIARIGELENVMHPDYFAAWIKKAIDAESVIYSRCTRMIKKVAVCGGAASEYWKAAMSAGADAFITGEAKHHEYCEASENNFQLIAAGHFATENPVVYKLTELLSEKFQTVDFFVAEQGTSPVKAV